MAATPKSKFGEPEASRTREPRGKNPAPSAEGAPARPSGTRETIESIVVAFVLAFLFKTFEAEAFVIPTGSMAPTLMGRHKDVTCPKCGHRFAIGASDEVESETDYLEPRMRIKSATCPNCRYKLPDDTVMNLPVFKGDRILVTKFSYEIADPKRWDVGVFKYPEEPKTNYIKRIVGLPNETIEIRQGNIIRVTEQGQEILRKDDPNKQRAIQLSVYDNDHPETGLINAGWPERWAAVKKAPAPDAVAGWSADAEGWTSDAPSHSFHLSSQRAASQRWLRYRHYVPRESDWADLEKGQKPISPKPQLITDFCGYNAYSSEPFLIEDFGLYWVGELTVNCRLSVTEPKPGAKVVLELNQGSRVYRCRIDLDQGTAFLSYAEPHDVKDSVVEHEIADGKTRCVGSGVHDVSFANVDDRLCLWVDNRLVEFDRPTTYEPYGGLLIQRPWDEDLTPVGIAAAGAEVTVSHLSLQRDIYYRCDFFYSAHGEADGGGSLVPIDEYEGDKTELTRRLDNPAEWFREYERGLALRQTSPGSHFENVPFQFTLGKDEFFMLGDNSPRSKDSRLWSNSRHAEHRYAVPRLALVGKAFFVYWPHGVPFMNNGRGYPDGPNSIWNNPYTAWLFYQQEKVHSQEMDHQATTVKLDTSYPKLRIPFYPNVARMRRIR